MNAFIMTELNNIYVKILKEGRNQYEKSERENTIKSAQELESYSTYLGEMTEKIKTLLDLTTKYAHECLERATTIRKEVDLNITHDGDPSQMFLIHKEMYKGLSWADINDREENREYILGEINDIIERESDVIKKEFIHTPILYKNLSNIYNTNIGFKFQVPIINKLNEMPSVFYWYNGDDTNPAGIYTCISRGFYVRVPFPNVVDSTKNCNKIGSIRCKNETYEECYNIRKELSIRYGSDIRECTFAHTGDKYIKIGTTFRCPHMPRFGNHGYLENDIKTVTDSDIKTILMYSLSDILLTSLWFQRQKKDNSNESSNITFNNIEIC
jgi:hypothetical protein